MESQQATPLIGEYILEDFYTEAPYLAIYNEKNKFLQNVMLQRTRDLAAGLGFKGFMGAWKAFMSTRQKEVPRVAGDDNLTSFDGQPMELKCGAYDCSCDRVTRVNEYGVEVEVISHPIIPTVRVRNIESGETKLKVAYKRGHSDDSTWREVTVQKDQVASAQKIVGLANYDVAVTSENAKDVVKYLSTLESLNYDTIPTQEAVAHLGWLPDGRFMPYTDGLSLDSMNIEFQKILSEMKPTGDEKKWMKLAKEVRAGDSVPCRIALAAGFAAPLVKMLYKQSFFVHFWGRGGCGKTVGVMLGISIWGNPEIGGMLKTFSGSKVSFEIAASFLRNLPLGLDELQVMKREDKKNYDDIIYMLCENASKGRGTRNGELQTQRRWNTCMITTGEEPIVNDDSGDGAKLRTIDINFKNIKFFGTDVRAKKAAILLQENYGHVGRRYIEFIQRKDVQETIKTLAEMYADELQETIEGKQVNEAVTLLVADAIANMVIFKDGRSLSTDDIREFLLRKDMPDASERCYYWLIDYCRANPRRFDAEEVNNGEMWGKFDGDYLYLNPAIFKRILKKERNFSAEQFLEWAKGKDLLRHEKDRMTFRVGPAGNQKPHYAIKLPDEEPEKPHENNDAKEVNNDGKFAKVDVEDIPF